MEIRLYGDDVLRRIAEPITDFDEELERLAGDMVQTMIQGDGIGLAAPQVGVTKRFLVIGLPQGDDEKALKILAMANPEIIWASEEESVLEEGCLSLPELEVEVERPVAVKVRYQNLRGETVELQADDEMLAKVIQHEMDHLDGRLIIDYLPALQRTLMKSKLKRRYAQRSAGGSTRSA